MTGTPSIPAFYTIVTQIRRMEFFFDSPAIRSLRGGSGGGRGGSGSSGGYYGGSTGSYGSSYNGGRLLPIWFYSSSSSNGTGEDKIATWVWIVLAVVIMLIVGCCCYCVVFRSRGETITKVDVDKDPEFEDAVSEARRNIAYVSSPLSSCGVRYQTYGGVFNSKYTDRGRTLAAELTLRLLNDGIGGYTVEGEGSDSDGLTKVTDGFISYNGTAWWLEEAFSGVDTGLKVLSKGTFDFANNTFSGTWRSSSQNQGDYVSFVGRDITNTMASSNEEIAIPIVEAEVEENLPVAYSIAAPMASPQVSIYK
ncbi:hypothetical protein ACHAW6_001962 [Cyclotella cf. meneghiniana]